MATDTAPTRVSPPARRQIWQLPVFVLGLTAAIVSGKMFPPAASHSSSEFERNVHQLGRVLEKPPIDVTEVEQLVAGLPADVPATDTRLNYLLGSAFTVLAERGAAGSADERWRRAHAHFGRCDPGQLTDPQLAQRFVFRAAKAAAANGVGDPNRLLADLDAVPPGEDPGERSRLIAETCVRLTPPDLKRAAVELAAFLSGPNCQDESRRARYQLQLGDWYLTTGDREKARSWLREIGPAAEPTTRAEAMVRLARLAVDERDLGEAIKLFQEAERLPGLPADRLAAIRFEAGRGLTAAGNVSAAKEYLTKVVPSAGAAGIAARVKLAELVAREADPEPAVSHLEAVAAAVKSAAEFQSPLVSLAELRGAFEAVVVACRTAGRYEAATRAAVAYRGVAADGRDRLLWSEVQAEWGEAQLAAGHSADGKSRLTQAAAEYVKLAGGSQSPADQANRLTRALGWYRVAGDDAGTSEVLTALAALPGAPPEVTGAANLVRGEQLLAAGQFAEGVKLLEQVVEKGGVVGTQASVRAAVAHASEGKRLLTSADAAAGRALLKRGQDLLSAIANRTFDTPDERLAHQEALYELGRLLISPNLEGILNYPEAELRFRRLLREYPNGKYAEPAALYLGICLTQLALGSHQNGTPPADSDRKFAEARDLFDGLTKAKSEWVRTHADMRLIHAMLLMKQLDELPQVCDRLAEKYRGRVQELIVLNMLYAGYRQAKRPDQARQVFERMEKAFAALPDTAYGNEMAEYTKAHWQDWFVKQRR